MMCKTLCLLIFTLTISLSAFLFPLKATVAKFLILGELSQEELPPAVTISHLVTGLRTQFTQCQTT